MIGIDLGTTNSCVAVMEGGVPQVIPSQNGGRTTPSVVAFAEEGPPLVGSIAKRQVLRHSTSAVTSVKRVIGRRFDSPESPSASGALRQEVVRGPGGDAYIRAGDVIYSPAEISALVLQQLKEAAEAYLGHAAEDVIISVPACFDDPQRQATKDAALIAGFRVVLLINEPTAAALAYGFTNGDKTPQAVAVYDLGGGTFDITILEMADGLFQVRATAGDTHLGGEDFDQSIIDWLIGEFQRETGIYLTQDRVALQRLKEAAEIAKRELSTAQKTEIVLPFISADASGPKHLDTVLTRRKYEELTDELLERTVEPCKRCLADAQLKAEQIDVVLLVGGQTRAPKVSELVRRVFGKEPNRAVHADEGVAMGAAIQAGIIQGEIKDLVKLDVTPYSLFTFAVDGTVKPLIERNSTIPTRTSRVFTTTANNQTRIAIDVWQGAQLLDAKMLGRFELTSIPPAPKGVPQVEVGFEIDVNGILSVEATDQATGRRQAMMIHPSGGLSQADVRRLADETRARWPRDPSTREREALLRQVSGLAINAKRSLTALEGQLTPDERRRILGAIELARQAESEVSLEELRARLSTLEKAAGIIGTAMLRPPLRRPDAPSNGPGHSTVADPSPRPRQTAPTPTSQDGLASEPLARHPQAGSWHPPALALYCDLIQTRLGALSCEGCGASLASAAILSIDSSGSLLSEYQLSDAGAARFLGATDRLLVECNQCGLRSPVAEEASDEPEAAAWTARVQTLLRMPPRSPKS